MTSGPDRDWMLDAHLRQSLQTGPDAPVTDACLDAETLAAWMDGGLDPKAVALAETHVSTCGRCQAMVGAMARTTPDRPATSAEPWWRRYRVGWLVPLAAGAAATALWMIVPSERPAAPLMPPESTEARSDLPAPAAEPPSPLPAKAEPAREEPPAAAPVEARKKEQTAPLAQGNAATLDAAKAADALQTAERVAPAASAPAAAPSPGRALGRRGRAGRQR